MFSQNSRGTFYGISINKEGNPRAGGSRTPRVRETDEERPGRPVSEENKCSRC